MNPSPSPPFLPDFPAFSRAIPAPDRSARALDFHYSIRLSAQEDDPAEPGIGVEIESTPQGRTRHEPRWYVILHDDQLHTYQYVIEMVVKLFSTTPQQAFMHAVEVDTQGFTILARLPKPEAIEKRDAILKYGGDPLMQTTVSMKATIEPVDD